MSQGQTEFEIKLVFPFEKFAAIQSLIIAKGGLRRQHLQAVYIDTADFLLSQAGLALRLRKEGRQWVQTLKARGAHELERLEHNVVLAHRGSGIPQWDISLHQTHLAGVALKKILDDHPSAVLQVLYETDIWRRSIKINTRQAEIEYALDQGVIRTTSSTGHILELPVMELEIELLKGDPLVVLEHAQMMVSRFKATIDTRSKAQRGTQLAQGLTRSPIVKSKPVSLKGKREGAQLAALINSCLSQVLSNSSEINLGLDHYDEYIHQLRIGLRRLRVLLKFLNLEHIALEAKDHQTLLKIFSALGIYRDSNFLKAKLLPRLVLASAPDFEWNDQFDLKHPAIYIKDSQFQKLLLSVMKIALLVERSDTIEEGFQLRVFSYLKTIYRDSRKIAKKFENVEDIKRHDLRKNLKKLRYLLEFFKDFYAPSKYKSYNKALGCILEDLGSYNDLCVAIDQVQELLERDPKFWFVIGWLRSEKFHVEQRVKLSLDQFLKLGFIQSL